MNGFVGRHRDLITGVLACFDRVIITGTLPEICHSRAMGGYLTYHKIRLCNYTRWAEPLREYPNEKKQYNRREDYNIRKVHG